MSVHRKFLPIKDFPKYNRELDRLIMNSNILNSNENDPHSIHQVLFDKQNMTILLSERIGDEDGYYVLNGKKQQASIPFTQGQVDQIEKTFAQYKKDRISQGFKAVDLMPAHLMEEFYILHARLTLYHMEADFLEKRLTEYKDKEDVESDNLVLKYGLRAFGKLHNGILETIDGQKCSELPDGTIIINDPRSKYHGIAVEDYRELCKVWQASRKAADKEKLEQLREPKEKGEAPPKQLPASSMHKANPSTFPAWPEGIRNYLTETKPKRVRITT
jgi:hypothetical protein